MSWPAGTRSNPASLHHAAWHRTVLRSVAGQPVLDGRCSHGPHSLRLEDCRTVVSRRAPRLIVEAFERTQVHEDQLGELFALTLQTHDELLDALLDRIHVARHREREVVTQQATPVGRRVDIELRLVDRARLQHVIWLELKEWAREQPEQLADYARDLALQYPGRSTLVALAPRGHRVLDVASSTVPPATPLSWEEVAIACDQAGISAYGSGWRRGLTAAEARAGSLILIELLGLLQSRGVVSAAEPLAVVDVLVGLRSDALLTHPDGSIACLLEAAAAELVDYELDPSSSWPKQRGIAAWQGRILTPRASPPPWPFVTREWNGVATLAFQPSDKWTLAKRGPREQPIFVAGFIFDPAPANMISAMDDVAWTAQLPDDVAIEVHKKSLQILKWVYMSEVVTWGITISEQAQALADWAGNSMRAIASLAPPPV